MLAGYCAGWSLRTLLHEGLNGVPDKVEAGPPRHMSSAVGQIVNVGNDAEISIEGLARLVGLGKRVGYSLWLIAMVLFFVLFFTDFDGPLVAVVVVMVDPHGESVAESSNERQGRFLVAGPARVGGKRHVEHHHAPWKRVWFRQFTGRSVRQMRETTHFASMWPTWRGCNSRVGDRFFPNRCFGETRRK